MGPRSNELTHKRARGRELAKEPVESLDQDIRFHLLLRAVQQTDQMYVERSADPDLPHI
jgi:hypothetical protein